MVVAGVIADAEKKQSFMINIPEVSILIPALLGLKGNLEMTLASRLSTMVYLFLNL